MVLDEAFDGWEATKAKYDYGLHFEQWWRRDLGDLIRRDRNHPSVILWGIGNEVRGATAATQARLVRLVHDLDPTRPITRAFSHSPLARGDPKGFDTSLDVIGLNGAAEEKGALDAVERAIQAAGDAAKPVVLTEAPHTYQTRGVYLSQTSWRTRDFPGAWEEDADWRKALENATIIDDLSDAEVFPEEREQLGHRQSSYDNATARISARRMWQETASRPWVAGQFVWLAFDYLGESYRWPARMHSSGVFDLNGLKKDHFYLYQSLWTDAPMVHLLPHWTHDGKAGVEIPVVAYTNCESVELFLNGRSLGEREYEGEQLVW